MEFTHTYLKQWIQEAYFRGSQESKRKRLVAISFDDGPNAEVTPRVLDILNTNGVQATFFWIARFAQQLAVTDFVTFNEILNKIRLGGHEVGLHAPDDYVPSVKTRLFGKFTNDELIRAKGCIESLADQKVTLYRPHILHLGSSVVAARDMGLTTIIGDLMHFPKADGDIDKQIKTASAVGSGGILILHDGVSLTTPRTQIVGALQQILDNLGQKGLEPTTVTKILK